MNVQAEEEREFALPQPFCSIWALNIGEGESSLLSLVITFADTQKYCFTTYLTLLA